MSDIFAQLIFDSWTDASPECRGARSEHRHLIYEGGGIVLDLTLTQTGDASRIHVGGQVLTSDRATGDVGQMTVLMEQGQQRAYTSTNALGEFGFQAVPSSSSFDLCIVLGNRRFQVQGLSKDEPRSWQVISSASAGGAS